MGWPMHCSNSISSSQSSLHSLLLKNPSFVISGAACADPSAALISFYVGGYCRGIRDGCNDEEGKCCAESLQRVCSSLS